MFPSVSKGFKRIPVTWIARTSFSKAVTDQHAPTMYKEHPPPMIWADMEEDEESPPEPPVMLVPLLSWVKLVYLCREQR